MRTHEHRYRPSADAQTSARLPVPVLVRAHQPLTRMLSTFDTQRTLRVDKLEKLLEARKRKEVEAEEQKKGEEEVFREFDTSMTHTCCPKGYHFIDDEGHIARNRKRERDANDDKSDAEKDAENAQAIMDDYAKDKAPVAESIAAKRVRIENLKTYYAVNIMYDALEEMKVDECGHTSKLENRRDLALLWEGALLTDITQEVHHTFNRSIQEAESEDNEHLTWP